MKIVGKTRFGIVSGCLITALLIEGFFIYKSRVYLHKDAKEILGGIVAEQGASIERTITRTEDLISNVVNIVENTIDFNGIRNNQKKIDKYEEKIAPILENIVKKSELKNIWYQADSTVLGGVSLIGFRETKGIMTREPKWNIIGSGYEGAEWWKGPQEKGENWTDIYYYKPWNLFLTSFGKKLEYKGKFFGIVSIDISVDEMKKELSKVVLYKTGFLILMDSNWNYIYRPSNNIIKIPEFDNVVLKKIREKIESKGAKKSLLPLVVKGEEEVLGYQKLSNGWTLLAIVPLREVTERANMILIFIVACAVTIVTLIGVFTAYVVSVLKRQYKMLENSYHYDNITDLPNRIMLIKNLEKYSKSGEGYLVILHIENIIEIFNMVGHSKSDFVLKSISEYFSHVNIGKQVEIYNSHSLKFEFFLKNYSFEELEIWINVFKNYINTFPAYIDEKCIFLKAIIGASYVGNNQKGDTVINKAYKALEFACDNFKEYYIYNDNLEKVFFTTFLVSQVNDAIRNDEFYLEYQPKLNLFNNSIEEVEALIRWRHSEYGIIPPNEFIPKLEKTDTIKLLTNWVINKVISDINNWDNNGIKLNVSINVTPRDLKDNGFALRLFDSLEKYKVECSRINVEITETDLIKEIDEVYDMLICLREKGIRISIDDFGTGYSSLSYINILPIDCIKVDRSFVKDLLVDEKKNKLLEDTISLLHNLEKTVVAEGVEDVETLNYLNEIGCEEIQGYYISRPLGKTALEEFLKSYI